MSRRLLLEVLEHIRKHGPHETWGICGNVRRVAGSLRLPIGSIELGGIYDVFTEWPKFSGDPGHPIPGGPNVYWLAKYAGKLWDKNTEYGALRWELLDFCIEELKKET